MEEGRNVVHPGNEGGALGPVAELHVLLNTRVQEADIDPCFTDLLAVQLKNEAQNAVC